MTMSGNGEEENGLIVLKHAAETKKVLSFIKLEEDYRPTEYKDHDPQRRKGGRRARLHQFCEHVGSHRPQSRAGARWHQSANGKGAAKKLPGPIGEISKKPRLRL